MAKQLKHISLASFLLLASVAGLPSSSAAQETVGGEPPLPSRSQDYLRDALSLARLLGRAHSIRVTCNGRTDQFWRLYMQEMLDLEAPNQGGLRDSMARTFNDAYADEASFRNWCNADAVAAEAKYAAQGRVLAEGLARHYFNRSD